MGSGDAVFTFVNRDIRDGVENRDGTVEVGLKSFLVSLFLEEVLVGRHVEAVIDLVRSERSHGGA